MFACAIYNHEVRVASIRNNGVINDAAVGVRDEGKLRFALGQRLEVSYKN
jgi:hypothetical protein